MDETIGVKGGKQDRIRTLKITKKSKKKLQELEEERQIKDLEKKIKKQQIYTLIKALPIAISGGFIKTIHDTAIGKKQKDKEEQNSKWRIKEYDGDISPKTPIEAEVEKLINQKKKEIVTPTGEKIIVYISDIPNSKKKTNDISDEDQIVLKEKQTKEKQNNPQKTKAFVSAGVGTPTEVINKNPEEQNNSNIEILSEEDKTTEKINTIKSRRIIEEYDRQLKEIRYELRNALFEFNILVHDENEIIEKEDAQKVLDNLTDLIDRIELIKDKMNIDNYDQYDNNYIYFLIESYFEDFNNKQIVKEIKESPFYIELAEKINDLDSQKNKFKKKVEEKKDQLENKEEQFSQLKNKYLSIDRINSKLIKFQIEQEKFLKDIQEKIANSTSITEKIEYEFHAINRQSKRMLRFMQFQMLLPGPALARVMSASALSHIIFLNNIISPQLTEKKYKVITVKDYSSEIKNSIDEIDSSIDLLGKTEEQIDRIITEINTKYKDYLGVVKECDEMLNNLNRMKSNIKEKEFEMEKMKQKQQKELAKNDAKVLTRGKYPVN